MTSHTQCIPQFYVLLLSCSTFNSITSSLLASLDTDFLRNSGGLAMNSLCQILWATQINDLDDGSDKILILQHSAYYDSEPDQDEHLIRHFSKKTIPLLLLAQTKIQFIQNIVCWQYLLR